jgi:hypothetical protein
VSDTAKEGAAGQSVFSPIVALAMVAVGALSLLFFTVFSAYAPEYSGEGDGRANALSRSAIGFAGLAAFLREQGIPVLISRGLSPEEYEQASLVVLTPGLNNTAAELAAVTDHEPMLIILPKWLAEPDPLTRGWVRNAGLYRADGIAERLLRAEAPSATVSQAIGVAPAVLRNGFAATDSDVGRIESLQTISATEWNGYVSDQRGRTILALLEGSATYILSEPDLMNTHGLKDLRVARFAAALIDNMREGSGPVIFDVTLSGYRRSPSLLRLAFEPPLLGATLCALLAALMMGVHAAIRFGAPLEGGRALALGKKALADNSAALIAMVGREHRIAPRYAAAIRRRVARVVGLPADAEDDALDRLMRQRARNASSQTVTELVAEAKNAKDAADTLRIARRLYRWRREMLNEP